MASKRKPKAKASSVKKPVRRAAAGKSAINSAGRHVGPPGNAKASNAAARDTARLLVIISDGYFEPSNYRQGQQLLDRLRTTGCGLLWLTTEAIDKPMTGTTVHALTNPASTAAVIGRAATTALKHATR